MRAGTSLSRLPQGSNGLIDRLVRDQDYVHKLHNRNYLRIPKKGSFLKRYTILTIEFDYDTTLMKNKNLIDRNQIIKELQRVANEKKSNRITRSEFSANTGISSWQIYQMFEGWREACQLAGLEPNQQNIPIDNENLFEEMSRVFLRCGEICTKTKFGKISKYSVDTYKKHFGQWKEVLFAFRKWLELKNGEFPYINQLPLDANSKAKASEEPKGKITSEIRHWQSIGATEYGSFLNFRGLQHAPLNEQGVVFLFGMICSDLGFVVETIRAEYPDCEAKRLTDQKRDRWEKVRVEFEFKSSSFKVHGHKPELCDVIVCWEHDWPDCPLEVIELKSSIKYLKNS